MKKLPPWLRKTILGACAIILIVAGGAGYAAYLVFKDLRVPINGVPNNLAANKATQKLEIFEQAREGGRSGYVRLSEEQINSHLFQNIQIEGKKSTASGLTKCRVLLKGDQISYWCWLEKEVLGRKMTLVWRRSFELYQNIQPVGFRMTDMGLGGLPVPRGYWARVTDWLGAVDGEFHKELAWMKNIPVLDIHTNENNGQTEILIYTKANPETAQARE